MTLSRRRATVVLGTISLFFIARAVQAEPAPAPDATFLLGHDIFADGQSDNLGPAISQRIDDYYEPGPCPDSDPSLTDYSDCDELRFGLSMYADAACTDANAYVDLVPPDEDGGALVDTRIKNIQNEKGTTYCASTQFIPHDTGLVQHWEYTFPGWDTATDADLDAWWVRPHLTLMVIGELPQSSPSDPGGRVKTSIAQACTALEGGPNGDLPSMPTWVMMARRNDAPAAPFAGLLAAAGGSGSCCFGTDTDADGFADCDPIGEAIDVCSHADGRSESAIRLEMSNGRYNCSDKGNVTGTGVMDFAGKDTGTLAQIKCHLVGEDYGTNCAAEDRNDTDILGIFACIRQLPRGLTWQDARIRYCPDDNTGCEVLTEANGGIEFIDPNKTLFKISNQDGTCDALIGGGGDVEIDECVNEGSYCDLPGATGRCSFGQYVCVDGKEHCEGLFGPMPEICNGLDDDCNGAIDDLAESWDAQPPPGGYSLPSDHVGLNCNERNSCVCPGGATDDHAGTDFESYLDEWDPVCHCGEGLSAPMARDDELRLDDEPQAACSSTDPSRDLPLVVALFLALGMAIVRRGSRGRTL